MATNNNTNLKILQWNARGLTKSRLQEFKHFLSYSVPSVVLLSETHWNDSFTPKFSSYNVINKNRHERSGGGVAILVHNSIKFSLLPLDNSHSIEMVAISISSATFFSLNFVSVYAPKGNSTTEEILSLFSQTGHFVIGGDFNAHHSMWESFTDSNRAGNSIWNALMELPDVALLTPPDLGTRIDPSTRKPSTIDLTFSSSAISLTAGIKLGPTLGSDHLPILMTIDESATPTSGRPQRWIFNDDKWADWNEQLATQLRNLNFTSLTEPEPAYTYFYDALLQSSNKNFRKSSSTPRSRPEPRRPWWDKKCNMVVNAARKAYRKWRDSPLSVEKRENWKKAEAVKRRHIIQAKKDSWKTHLTNLDICDDPSKLWNFVRGMLGKKISGNPLDNAVLKDLEGREYHSAQEKAGLILEAFSRNFSTLIPNNDFYETAISTSIASPTPNAFNSVITLAEINLLPEETEKYIHGNRPYPQQNADEIICRQQILPVPPVQHPLLSHIRPRKMETSNHRTSTKIGKGSGKSDLISTGSTHVLSGQAIRESSVVTPGLVYRI